MEIETPIAEALAELPLEQQSSEDVLDPRNLLKTALDYEYRISELRNSGSLSGP